MILNPLTTKPAESGAIFSRIGAGTPVNWQRVALACLVAGLAGIAFMGAVCLVP